MNVLGLMRVKSVIFLLLLVAASSCAADIYRWADSPQREQERVLAAHRQLQRAYDDAEYMLSNELTMPVPPTVQNKREVHLTLREAILLALRYNPNVQNAEIDRILNRYDLIIARNAYEWNYAFKSSFTHQGSRSEGVRAARTTSLTATPSASLKLPAGGEISFELPTYFDGDDLNPTATVSFKQPLLRGSGADVTQADLRKSYDQEILNQLSLKDSIISVVTNVVKRYRALILSNNTIETQRTALQEAIKAVENNKAKIKAGQLARVANVQQQAQVEQLRLQLVNAENEREITKQSLLDAVGLDPDINIIVPKDVNVHTPTVPKLHKTVDDALHQNLTYIKNLFSYKQKKRDLMLAIDQQRWDLLLTLNATVGSSSGTGIDANMISLLNGRNGSQSLNLTLNIPIDDKARKKILIQAKLFLEKEKILLAQAERKLVTDVKNSLTRLRNQIQQIKLSQSSVLLAKEAYEVELKKQQAGISTALDVTTSQNQLVNNQNTLISNKIAYLNTMTDLQQLLATTLDEWRVELRYK